MKPLLLHDAVQPRTKPRVGFFDFDRRGGRGDLSRHFRLLHRMAREAEHALEIGRIEPISYFCDP